MTFRPSELAQLLEQLGTTAKKNLSQNFLIDGNILRKILSAAGVSAGDLVIEIGPGPGALTEALLAAGAHVIAIEKDPIFASALHRLQTKDGRLEVHTEDVLNFPFATHLQGKAKVKVVANLPYHITTPILAKLILLHENIESLTLMVQKEVAERFTAQKNTPEYGSLTIFLQAYSTARYCFTVGPTCFYPKPNVHSAVVHFSLKTPLDLPADFFCMTRTAFQKRRKMLRASLRELHSPEIIEQALSAEGLNPQARPEDLSLDEFRALYLKLQVLASS
jgi:16S rRNA (adenine1518-N6/adenine1519-N6)-dimethyltransferase